jgi:tryptophan 2,3-dioxygenase
MIWRQFRVLVVEESWGIRDTTGLSKGKVYLQILTISGLGALRHLQRQM